MGLEELLKAGIIKKTEASEEAASRLLKITERDLKVSRDNLARKHYEWAYVIAYNSMLQAARAVMLANGFIPSGQFGHVAIVRFAEAYFGEKEQQNLLSLFEKMRRRRHKIVYDDPDVISLGMAKHALETAENFFEIAKKEVHENVLKE